MPRKKEVEVSVFSDIPSPELLIQFHAAKSKKDNATAEMISGEFLRRDKIIVNESILGRPKERPAPIIEIAQPKKQQPRRTKNKDNCIHNFNMVQESFFAGMLKTEMCSLCGTERIAR